MSEDPSGCETAQKAAALIAHASVTFSEIHSFLNHLAEQLDLEIKLQAQDFPYFIPGRGAVVLHGVRRLGLIGEVHPEVLERWDIKMPCAVFEIDL